MIFAPRSCPSRPGLAITTRIFRSTWAVYGGENLRHRLLARLAQSGRRPLGLPPRALRRAAPRRLRPGRAAASPPAGGVAERRCDRDHPLPSRPLGRSRPVGVGRHVSLGRIGRDRRSPRALGAPGWPGRSWRTSASGSASGTCSIASSPSTSTRPKSRSWLRGSRWCPCGSRTTPSRRTGSGSRADGVTIAYSGDSGPSERLAELARDSDLFICEATLDARCRRRPSSGPPERRRGARGSCGLRNEAAAAHASSGRARRATAGCRTGTRRPRDRAVAPHGSHRARSRHGEKRFPHPSERPDRGTDSAPPLTGWRDR